MQTSRILTYSFNTQPPEGGWALACVLQYELQSFNTQPPEGGWGQFWGGAFPICEFQHTAARRRLVLCFWGAMIMYPVSTHSRPKAAGLVSATLRFTCATFQHTAARRRLGDGYSRLQVLNQGFNTQPPEGGWITKQAAPIGEWTFQHTAARRRLVSPMVNPMVSTHSRPKAAGQELMRFAPANIVSTHSRPKAAGISLFTIYNYRRVSTHSRPKAAGAAINASA